MAMIFEKASKKDISALCDLRIAYLIEDFGTISSENLKILQKTLPKYYKKHLNKDLFIFVAKRDAEIVACAFLLLVEKPASPSFITGKTGTVLNVYTKPKYRKNGYAKKLLTMLLKEAKEKNVSVIELKSTEAGYLLYKALGFEELVEKYHNMKIVLR